LDSFFNLSRDLLCIAGTDRFFRRLNPAWEKKLGYSIKELLAIPFFEFLHPDDRQPSAQEVEKLKGTQTTVDFENRFRCRDGSYQWNATPSAEHGLIYAVGRESRVGTQARSASRAIAPKKSSANISPSSIPLRISRLENRSMNWRSRPPKAAFWMKAGEFRKDGSTF
jgi:PAS domain S-box-containing protein